MDASRRQWLKYIGLTSASIGVAGIEGVASPFISSFSFATNQGEDLVRLSSNENPYGPSPNAITAMAEHVAISNRYQWQMARDLISAIATKNKLSDEHVLIGAGSTQIIDAVAQLAAMDKGSFIVSEPTFSRWAVAAEKARLQKITVSLTADKLNDLSAMSRAVRKDTRLVYVCNPNNPTGTICDKTALEDFVKEVSKRSIVLVDEAYLDYANQPSLASYVLENENLIVVKTFSKIYGLAGARVGYALAHKNTIEKLGQLQSGANGGISAVSMAGALASLKDETFFKMSFARNEQASAYTIEQLEHLGIRCIPSATNFIYFSLEGYQKDFFGLLKANNIEGTGIFEERGKWSRITVGTMQEMQQFIRAVT
jgi:histidinol-phosphate aminotransferase